MNVPNAIPIPDLTDANRFQFPSLAADDPAVRTVESLPFPIPELGDRTPPAIDAAHFFPPQMNEVPSAGPVAQPPMQTDGAFDFDPAMLKALASDPIAARTLEHLRRKAADKLAELTDQAFAMLAQEEKSTSPKSLFSGGVDIKRFMAASRSSEFNARIRRELAEALVTGSAINLNNTNWNPADPASSISTEKSLISALLQMEI
jgi:hypothetical protein